MSEPDENLNKSTPVDESATESHSVSSRPGRNDASTASLYIRIPKPQFQKLRAAATGWRRFRAVGLVAALLISLAAGFLGGWLASSQQTGVGLFASPEAKQKQVVTSQSQLINRIAKTVGPSVVSVDVISQQGSSSGDPYNNLFGFGGGSQQVEDAGTGIIISKDGLILTNRHVVPQGTTSVSVTLSDGTQLNNVQVVGRTSENDSLDIAFLKITDTKGHKLEPAVIGDSSKVQVGDSVVAIGNALGQFQNTVTSGIISGYGRSVQAGDSSGLSSSTESLDDLFQTDAAINEGNSGGPLVNLNGQVIGINTAIAGDGAQNIGFAIPINDVRGLITQVEQTGKFERPYLGVRYIPITADVAKYYSLSVTQGAYVAPSADPSSSPSVLPNSPAKKAGLKAGDIITQINGTNIDQKHSLTALIDQHKVGDKLKLTVMRGGKQLTLTATLGTMPQSSNNS